jgi:prephenate dehydrogenase
VLDLAQAGHRARLEWENREFGPVDLPADPQALRQHGRDGGWITAVIEKDGPDLASLRLLGMRPVH